MKNDKYITWEEFKKSVKEDPFYGIGIILTIIFIIIVFICFMYNGGESNGFLFF
jgi:hypothetical protein